MDVPLIISVIALAVIAAVEIVCLLMCRRIQEKEMPMYIALPLLPDDGLLTERLDYLRQILTDPASRVRGAVLIDFGTGERQLQLCREFCDERGDTYIIQPKELEVFMKDKIFPPEL